MFLDISFLLEKVVTVSVCGWEQYFFIRTLVNSLASLWLFLAYLLYTVFGDDSNSAHLSEWLANVATILDRHVKNDKQSFKNVKWQMASVNYRIWGLVIKYCVCDFLFYRHPCMTKENMLWKCREHKGIWFTDNRHNNLSILQVKNDYL